MNKPTKGPWSVSDLGDMQWITDGGGRYLAEIVLSDEEGLYVKDEGERAANANLTAAAPTMYRLLCDMAAEIEDDTTAKEVELDSYFRSRLKDIIAIAEGGFHE